MNMKTAPSDRFLVSAHPVKTLLACLLLLLWTTSSTAEPVIDACPPSIWPGLADGSEDPQIGDLSQYPELIILRGEDFSRGRNAESGERHPLDTFGLEGNPGLDGEDGPDIIAIARTVVMIGTFDLRGGRGGNGGRGADGYRKLTAEHCGQDTPPGRGGKGGKGGRGGNVTIIAENFIYEDFQLRLDGGIGGDGGRGGTLEGNCVCPGVGAPGGDAGNGGDTGRFSLMACFRSSIAEKPSWMASGTELPVASDDRSTTFSIQLWSCPGPGGWGGTGGNVTYGKTIGRGQPGIGGAGGYAGYRFQRNFHDWWWGTSDCKHGDGEPGEGGVSDGLDCVPSRMQADSGVMPEKVISSEIWVNRELANPWCTIPVLQVADASNWSLLSPRQYLDVTISNIHCDATSSTLQLIPPVGREKEYDYSMMANTIIGDEGTATDRWVRYVGDEGIAETSFDAARRSMVTKLTGPTSLKSAYSLQVAGHGKKSLFSAFVKNVNKGVPAKPMIGISLQVEEDRYSMEYFFGDGEDKNVDRYGIFHMGKQYTDGNWHLFSRDIYADFHSRFGREGEPIVMMFIYARPYEMYLDDVILGDPVLNIPPGSLNTRIDFRFLPKQAIAEPWPATVVLMNPVNCIIPGSPEFPLNVQPITSLSN